MNNFKLNDTPNMGNAYNNSFNEELNLNKEPNFNNQHFNNINNSNNYSNNQYGNNSAMKFCKFCGEKIPMDAVVCVKCGRQVEELRREQERIVINNVNNNTNRNTNVNSGRHGNPKSKVIALLLCFFFGFFGFHKFYEGKVKTGIIYLFTAGVFGFGWICDLIALIFKPNIYYVDRF